jgi:NAD(P)-dependent dehydrogenase (short-subunit alcohol dehydrogenase family)
MNEASKVVLITGCSTGMGRATALRLAQKGHVVYATARREEAIADLKAAGARTMALDVTDESSMSAAVDRVVAEHGAVGVLVNNAGYSQSGALETLPMSDLRRQFETNVFGLVRMCQLVLPGMRNQGWGRIVNISSMGGNFTFPGAGAYHGSKYAVEAISDALRFEVKGFGVEVVIVQPGLIRTEFASTAVTEMGGDWGPYANFNASVGTATQEVYQKGPLAKMGGPPEAVAKAVEKAVTARNAPIRVRVTPSAHVLIRINRLMTDRMWDRFLSKQFPRPGTAEA